MIAKFFSRTGFARYEGEEAPPWYYGFAYDEWHADRNIWMPIPINFIARWHRRMTMSWNVWRGRTDSFTAQVRRMATRREQWARERGYEQGYMRGLERGAMLERERL